MEGPLLDMSGPEINKATSAESVVSAKKQEKPAIVELKNGKVIFKQKPMSFEKQSETLQEIVTFRGMLEDRISKQAPPLAIFPEDHKPLVAKLAHESDKSLAVLAKHVHHELLPTLDEEEEISAVVASAMLPLSMVEDAIRSVLTRNNYGLDAPLGVKLPVAVCIWRWEVKAEYLDWLPKNSKEKAEARLADRVQAREDLKRLFEALPQEERDAIIDPKKTSTKLPTKELNRPETTPNPESKVEESKGTPASSKKQGKKKAEEVENDQTSQSGTPSGPGRPKKVQDPEKAAKEKERLEKKAARLEKEQKEKDAKSKSQSLMANFFSRPKATVNVPKKQDIAVAGPSRLQSDFDKMFKPFVLQKDKVMAPQNWFVAEKRRRRRGAKAPNSGVIVIDSDGETDVEMLGPQPTVKQLKNLHPQDRLRSLLSDLPPPASSLSSSQKRPNPQGIKTHHRISVRDLMSQLSEAEISGNDDLVREILAKLRDRDLLTAKAFSFHDDARPGYFGTWTRSSRIIGPRTPFAKDTLVFDYGYDSGEEWEEEPAGEDVAEDGEDEDGDGEDPDSDLDSWLVDDDEETADLASLARGASPPPIFDSPTTSSAPKRKAEDGEQKMGKKRKVIIPLVAFAKGPMFESTIGQVDYEPFRPYAIQLFNDTPMSIDPFTFMSSSLEDYKTSQRNVPAGQVNNDSNGGIFVVPALPPRLTALPPRLTATTFVNTTVDPSSQTPATTSAPRKAPTVPKSVFPDVYMAFLLDKINQLQASSINALVESIYHELREHKVKKIAIEAKVREVSEKCKDKKVWIVKPALMQTQVL